MATTGTRRVSSCALSSRTRPSPSMIGMRISVSTRSAPARTIAQIAPSACSASWTSYPAFRRERHRISRTSVSSSTTRIFLLVLDFVMFAFQCCSRLSASTRIPIRASRIVRLHSRVRQCDNANPLQPALGCFTFSVADYPVPLCAGISRMREMQFHKLEGFALGFLDLAAVTSGQAMFGSSDLMKLKRYAVLLQFLRHHPRLLERHVSVRRTVNQRCGRKLRGDILHRHEREELFRFHARIPPGDRFRPKPVLTAKVVEDAAIAFTLPGIGHGGPADLPPRLLGADLSLIVPWMLARGRIPIADQISVAKIGQKNSRTGMDPVTRRQRKI